MIEETLEQRLENSYDKKVADDVDERKYPVDSLCSSGMGDSSTSTPFCGDLVVRRQRMLRRVAWLIKMKGFVSIC